jgi:hypothetical protein
VDGRDVFLALIFHSAAKQPLLNLCAMKSMSKRKSADDPNANWRGAEL